MKRKWLAGVVAALVLAVGAIYAIGFALPRNHVASVERSIPMPVEAVAARIRSVRDYPTWRPGTYVQVTGEDAGGVSYVETQNGDRVAYRLTETEPGRRFIAAITDEDLPYRGRWTYTLTPQGEATFVHIEEAGEIRDPLYRVFARFVFGYASTMEGYLDRLEASAAGAESTANAPADH